MLGATDKLTLIWSIISYPYKRKNVKNPVIQKPTEMDYIGAASELLSPLPFFSSSFPFSATGQPQLSLKLYYPILLKETKKGTKKKKESKTQSRWFWEHCDTL